MSTHNMFCKEIRKLSVLFGWKKAPHLGYDLGWTEGQRERQLQCKQPPSLELL